MQTCKVTMVSIVLQIMLRAMSISRMRALRKQSTKYIVCYQEMQSMAKSETHPPMGSPTAASKPAEMMMRLGLNS